MADQTLLQTLLSTPMSDKDEEHCYNDLSSSNSGIVLRILLIIVIGAISIWANHEASKGFSVIIINDAKDSPAGKKFDLFYESTDKAIRILLNASSFVENVLYEDVPRDQWKEISHVALRLSGNISIGGPQRVSVTSSESKKEFVIWLGSSVMEDSDFDHLIKHVLQRAMARIWLWGDDEFGAPPQLVDGMAEYVAMLAGFGCGDGGGAHGFQMKASQPLDGSESCWEGKDPIVLAKLLGYCEGRSKGFIRRLNQEMRRPWHDRTVDFALGMRAQSLCDSFNNLRGQHDWS